MTKEECERLEEKIINDAMKDLQHYFLSHMTIYSKELMEVLEKETSIKWFEWSGENIKPTEFNPNKKFRYWLKRLFTWKFAVIVSFEKEDGLEYSFINPFSFKYKVLKFNKKPFIRFVKQVYPKK